MHLISEKARWSTYHLRYPGKDADIIGNCGSAYTGGFEGARIELVQLAISSPMFVLAIRETVPDTYFIACSISDVFPRIW